MTASPKSSVSEPELEAVVLAGGKSVRMGQDKAGMRLGGRLLVDWAVKAATDAGLHCRLQRDDHVAGQGPLGGMWTAFQDCRAEGLIFLSCDMPFVTGAEITRLIVSWRTGDEAAQFVVADQAGFPCLVGRKLVPQIEESLRDGRRSVRGLLNEGRDLVVEATEAWRFHNVNSPRDWAEAKRLSARHWATR